MSVADRFKYLTDTVSDAVTFLSEPVAFGGGQLYKCTVGVNEHVFSQTGAIKQNVEEAVMQQALDAIDSGKVVVTKHPTHLFFTDSDTDGDEAASAVPAPESEAAEEEEEDAFFEPVMIRMCKVQGGKKKGEDSYYIRIDPADDVAKAMKSLVQVTSFVTTLNLRGFTDEIPVESFIEDSLSNPMVKALQSILSDLGDDEEEEEEEETVG